MSDDAWYAENGIDNDVVLSTRLRLSRNLANFTFPSVLKADEAQRVQTLIFDSFGRCSTPDLFQAIPVCGLDSTGAKILAERGVIESSTLKNEGTGIVMRTDGKVCCTVNDQDHVRISAFTAGLDCEKTYALCRLVDDELQNTVQFAASYEFGFLTSNIKDAGSGMKVSARVHLPSITFAGLLREVVKETDSQNIEIRACFGAGNETASALGCFYQVSTKNGGTGSEAEQMANLVAAVKYLTDKERSLRGECKAKHLTQVKDKVSRSFALSKFASLINLREGCEMISDIKWGVNLGLLNGIENADLTALLYRIQEGHLEYVIKSGTFTFTDDISNDEKLKVQRLRALILQEAFDKLKI